MVGWDGMGCGVVWCGVVGCGYLTKMLQHHSRILHNRHDVDHEDLVAVKHLEREGESGEGERKRVVRGGC